MAAPAQPPPPHVTHVSDVRTWKAPDRDFTVFLVLSLLPFAGFLGLDHVYLRSHRTALQKLGAKPRA